jgi:hypothetical protein
MIHFRMPESGRKSRSPGSKRESRGQHSNIQARRHSLHGILMFRKTALASPRRHGLNSSLENLLIRSVRTRRQLDQRVQGNVEPRRFLLVLFHEVGVDAAQDGLVRDDEDVFAAFQLHDYGLEPDYDVAVAGWGLVSENNGGRGGRWGNGKDIRFSTPIPIIVFILISGLEILGIQLLDLGIGHVVADAGVQLVKGFPLQLVVFLGEVAGGCDGAPQSGGPDC